MRVREKRLTSWGSMASDLFTIPVQRMNVPSGKLTMDELGYVLVQRKKKQKLRSRVAKHEQ